MEDTDDLHYYFFRLCILTQAVFFFIELIQLQEQGMNYFMGWNLVDFSQFWAFVAYCQNFPASEPELLKKQIEFLLIVLAFMKILFFIRIFDDYSFLVQMIILTIIDLIPFTASFVLSLWFFSLCFIVLGTEPDEEIAEVSGPGFNQFGLFILQAYRISVGEVGVPQYSSLQ